MFLLFPKKIRRETSLTPAQCRKKLNQELIEHNRKPSLIAANQFIRNHRFECCYFGSWDKSGKFELFYHQAKKHDGSSAGFFGKIEKSDKGSIISGKIKRTAAVMITAVVWIIASVLFMLVLLALKEYKALAVMAVVAAAGLMLIIYDSSEKYLRNYLESFPEKEASQKNED